MRQLDPALVNTINARNVAVAERIDAVYMSAAPTPEEKVLDFDSALAVADAFVGRETVFAALETFRTNYDRGYFDIVAEAGLGKTALAAAIARRRDAICFFASANRGLKRADQFLTHASAALIVKYKLNYERLPENIGNDATFFTKVLRQAVATLPPGSALWLVVDGLDEAESPADEANPLLLPDELPKSAYIVVTRRPGLNLFAVANTAIERYTIHRDDADQESSIDAYLRAQAKPPSRVAQALAAAKPPIGVEEFVTRLKAGSERNFMYLSYAIEDISNRKPNDPPLDLHNLPKGLFGYYERFWSRLQEVKAAEGWADWNGLFRPVIERLGVAFEPVPAEWLGKQINRTADEVLQRALERWQRLLGREQRNGTDGWRLVHRSFADFLATKVDLGAAHSAVADYYAAGRNGDRTKWDSYGLKHTISHYAEASQSKPLERHAIVERMVALVTDGEFQKASLDQLADPTHIERDLELTLRTASEDEQKPAMFLLAEVALPLVTFRRQQRQPLPIFELAGRGELVGAERRLDLFALDVDEDWYDALRLTIAWLGAAKKPQEARRIFDRVRLNGRSSPTLNLLMSQVAASLDNTIPPQVPLDAPAALPLAEAIVARLSGSSYDQSLLGGFGPELLYQRGGQSDDVFYLAHQDGQPLVALALVDPAHGEPLLRRYVNIHAAYGYRQYRSGSLWALLDAVLRHPNPDWVRSWVPILGEAVLAPIRGEFQEALELAALGQRALLADASALAALDERADAALKATEDMQTANTRGQGDVWGTHKRRLAALAETLVRIPDRQAKAAEMIGRAIKIQFGFAGFSAPAALRLAESVHIATPGDASTVERALNAAVTSAHNINDPTFCARTTARINAVRENWWTSLFTGVPDPGSAAQRLRRDSATSEFAARHHVGENYAGRDTARTVPLPDAVLSATTLAQLATAYERPLSDFMRLNPGLSQHDALTPGTAVNVPDPGLAPFIATSLSAQALADPALSEVERAGVVRSLVPVASRDVTALDTLLARLLISSQAQDLEALQRLQQLAAVSSAETPALDSPPQGELSAFPA